MTRPSYPLLALLLALAPAACATREAPPREEQLRARIEALQGPDERLLDVASDGALLVSRELPAQPDSDHELALAARVIDGKGAATPLPAPVQDARFVPGSREVFAVSSGGELLRMVEGEAPVRLDIQAHGPLAVGAGRVVYARGEAPDLEIVAWERGSGAVVPLTRGMAPAWSPAVGEGGEVVFVSARSGLPELYAVGEGEPRKLTDRAGGEAVPFPSSPQGPRLAGGVLYFEEQGAARGVEVSSGKLVWSVEGGGTPIPLGGGAVLLARGRGAEVVRAHREAGR
jgi:hypothetical protein